MNLQPLGQPAAAEADVSADRWGATSLGMAPELAAGLGYLPLVGPFIFYREKRNSFVRFHAAQATLMYAAFVALFLIRAAIFAVVDHMQSLAAMFLGQGIACVFGLVTLAFIGLWIWGLISGFTGRYTQLPLVGGLAESWADVPDRPTW